jgi:hypothetical protein
MLTSSHALSLFAGVAVARRYNLVIKTAVTVFLVILRPRDVVCVIDRDGRLLSNARVSPCSITVQVSPLLKKTLTQCRAANIRPRGVLPEH